MSGYLDCPCCGEIFIGTSEEVCDACVAAGCWRATRSTGSEEVYGEDCQIPMCPDCETRATWTTSLEWSSSCDEPCPNAGVHWR